MSDYTAEAKSYIEEMMGTLMGLDVKAISDVINVFTKALDDEKAIYVFGNGGSASTASHMQNDFNKGISEFSQKKFRFHCLNDNVATITAIANDYSYDDIFKCQLDGRLSEGDVVVAISGSGNSGNIIRAVEYAKEKGNLIIGMTGFDGGELKRIADYNLHVNVNDMQIVEDIHIMFNHLMMSILCRKYRGEGDKR